MVSDFDITVFKNLMQSLTVLVISKSETIPQEEILDHCETYGFTETTVMKALDEMRREGEIYAPKEGKYRGVGR